MKGEMTDLEVIYPANLEVTYPANWVDDRNNVSIKKCDLDDLVKDAARYQFFVRNCNWIIDDKSTCLSLRLHGTPNCDCYATREGAIDKEMCNKDNIVIKTYLNLETILVTRKK